VRHTETGAYAKNISELESKLDEISDANISAYEEIAQLFANSLEECHTKTAGICTRIQEHVLEENKGQQECIAQQQNLITLMGQALQDLTGRVGQLETQLRQQSAQQLSEQQLRAQSTQRQPNQLSSTLPQSSTQSTDEPKTVANSHDDEPAILVTPELAQMELQCNVANRDEHTEAATTTAKTATATTTTKAATTAMTARWLRQPLFTLVHYPRPWDLRQADYAEYQPDDESSVKLTFQHRMWTSRLSKIDRTMHEQIVAEAGVNYWDSTEDGDSFDDGSTEDDDQ
jgi:hypothetical protein